jgi:4-hydroxymandelate synthase
MIACLCRPYVTLEGIVTVKIDKIDHIEFYVEDAAQTANELCAGYGFQIHGRGGPETALSGCRSILLRQHDITLLITSATAADHPAAAFVREHGDGPAVIAFAVPDARACFATAVQRGAKPVAPPAGRQVVWASVQGFGDVAHRFVSRPDADGGFAADWISETPAEGGAGPDAGDGLLRDIDHIAVCLPAGELAPAVQAYQDVFGFSETFRERIIVGEQAMDSIVVQSPSGVVTFTLLEPDVRLARGQITEFVEAHRGAGVQHIAFRTPSISDAIRDCTKRGVSFLATPSSYYDALPARLGPDLPLASLRELNILADRDKWGMMFQIFTRSTHSRHTFFYELIERQGALTFGSNNIKALYEAVERQLGSEQALQT